VARSIKRSREVRGTYSTFMFPMDIPWTSAACPQAGQDYAPFNSFSDAALAQMMVEEGTCKRQRARLFDLLKMPNFVLADLAITSEYKRQKAMAKLPGAVPTRRLCDVVRTSQSDIMCCRLSSPSISPPTGTCWKWGRTAKLRRHLSTPSESTTAMLLRWVSLGLDCIYAWRFACKQAAELITGNAKFKGKMHYAPAKENVKLGEVNSGSWFKKVGTGLVRLWDVCVVTCRRL
jgi:hypothetical protein